MIKWGKFLQGGIYNEKIVYFRAFGHAAVDRVIPAAGGG
jgi:hypothetical protein